MVYEGEGIVKREESAGLAQSKPSEVEEISLIRKIEVSTKNLLQSLNSIESVANSSNKILLPIKSKAEGKSEVKEKRVPQGWLECHLADLDHAIWRTGQIYEEVTRLMQATKIDKVGQ